MKKYVMFVLIGILLLSLLLVSAKTDYSGISKCLKTCSNEKQYSTLSCRTISVWENYDCRYQYKLCIFDMKNSSGKTLSECRKEYTICTGSSRNTKKTCVANSTNSYDSCKVSCRAKTCPDIYQPVCGYSGLTYDNECLLRKAGDQLAYSSECIRYCYSDSDCKDSEFCQLIDGSCNWNYGYLEKNSACFSNDIKGGCMPMTGMCTKIPEECTTLYSPVCGCDGKTYANDCVMKAAKQSKSYDGECENVNCTSLGNQIQSKIDKARECSKDSDCEIGFIYAPCNFLMCGTAYNPTKDLTLLYEMSDKYTKSCRQICPMYMCIDPYFGKPKCSSGKCEIVYPNTQIGK